MYFVYVVNVWNGSVGGESEDLRTVSDLDFVGSPCGARPAKLHNTTFTVGRRIQAPQKVSVLGVRHFATLSFS